MSRAGNVVFQYVWVACINGVPGSDQLEKYFNNSSVKKSASSSTIVESTMWLATQGAFAGIRELYRIGTRFSEELQLDHRSIPHGHNAGSQQKGQHGKAYVLQGAF